MTTLPDIDVEAHDGPPLLTDEMVELIIRVAKEGSNKLLSRATARRIYEVVIQTAITETIRTGQFRLAGGWGQFVLKYIPAARRRAFGKTLDIPARAYVRYHEGNAVKTLLDRSESLNYRRKKPRLLDEKTL